MNYLLRNTVKHAIRCGNWIGAERALLNLRLMEIKAQNDSIYELVEDYTLGVKSLPVCSAKYQLVILLNEALHRDTQFIVRHPELLFQCLWNRCWWYDCPEAVHHYDPPENGWGPEGAPWDRRGQKLHQLLEHWLDIKKGINPDFSWLRSLKPPLDPLGFGQISSWTGHHDAIIAIKYSQDGKQVISHAHDQTIRLWDANSGQELVLVEGVNSRCVAVGFFAPNQPIWVETQGDHSVWVNDILSQKRIAEITVFSGKITRLALSDNGHLIVATDNYKVEIWDIENKRKIASFDTGKTQIECLSISYSAKTAAGIDNQSNIHVWQLPESLQIEAINSGAAADITISSDGRLLATGGFNEIDIISVDSNNVEIQKIKPNEPLSISVIASSQNGEWIVTGSQTGEVRVWNSSTHQMHNSWQSSPCGIDALCVSPNGTRVACGNANGTIYILPIDNKLSGPILRGHLSHIDCFEVSLKHDFIATGSTDAIIKIWDSNTGCEVKQLRGHDDSIEDLQFLPDGLFLISISHDHTARIWEMETFKEVACFHEHHRRITAITVSDDGNMVVTGSSDGELYVWNSSTRSTISFFGKRDNKSVQSVDISKDNQFVVAGTMGGMARVYRISKGKKCAQIRDNKLGVGYPMVFFTHDNRHVCFCGLDNEIKLWDFMHKKLTCAYRPQSLTSGLAVTNDRKQIVVRLENSTMVILDADTLDVQRQIKGSYLSGIDIESVNQGTNHYPWRAVSVGSETAIISAESGQPVGWCLSRNLSILRDGCTWVGLEKDNLALHRIEGMPLTSKDQLLAEYEIHDQYTNQNNFARELRETKLAIEELAKVIRQKGQCQENDNTANRQSIISNLWNRFRDCIKRST